LYPLFTTGIRKGIERVRNSTRFVLNLAGLESGKELKVMPCEVFGIVVLIWNPERN